MARGSWRRRLQVALVAWLVLASGCSASPGGQQQGRSAAAERERAIAAALELYRQRKAAGTDFSQGPCLSQEVVPGWAVDVAHDPRQPVDDLPANQCASYREGRVRHFVELDPEGRLIRAR